MNIAVLSTNPDLYSTKRLLEAAEKRGHKVVIINHTKCNLIMEKGRPSIQADGKTISDIEAIIPRIGASVSFFGAAVIRQFEMLKVFSSLSSIALVRSRDKLRSLQLMSKFGLGIPKSVFAKFPKDKDVEDLIEQVGGAPVIIKVLQGTQGLGIVLADTTNSAKSMVEAFSGLKQNILIQEFIAEAHGADIRAFVVGNKVVAAMKRTGKTGEFRSNIHRGGVAEPIELSKKEKVLAVEAARSLGLSIAGVDMLLSERGMLIIEVNSSPGLQGIERATGVDVAGQIIEFVEAGVQKKKQTKKKKQKDIL
ncbi:MAG: 30S ribosomal protein S6--L-glutamate ligase [Patescibacteria group bacterium]